MANAEEERYGKLGIGPALLRSHTYPVACKELSFILRRAYRQLPKVLKSTVFDDALTAFRLLPQMKTQNAVSAATLLAQAADAALPKQKKNVVLTEFKHAKIAHKKQSKDRQEVINSSELPQDVLLHIFSYLDFQSLISATLVCWSWNFAANCNSLWQSQYTSMFSHAPMRMKIEYQQNGERFNDQHFRPTPGETAEPDIDWREAFKRACLGHFRKKIVSFRGYCRPCKAIVWLNCINCSDNHKGPRLSNNQIKPMSHEQVVDFLLGSFCSSDSDSDSDPDDDQAVSRLWAYPKSISS